jgi:hypothetical protein
VVVAASGPQVRFPSGSSVFAIFATVSDGPANTDLCWVRRSTGLQAGLRACMGRTLLGLVKLLAWAGLHARATFFKLFSTSDWAGLLPVSIKREPSQERRADAGAAPVRGAGVCGAGGVCAWHFLFIFFFC